ncbi:MAG: hypothetical protein GXP55_08820 [Deltaproteobacteria bacterium]|nr:hypothetical protein [Deltaproteobacteria bacterium]
MNIETDAVIPFCRDRVYRAYRDEITDLVEYLPNVNAIEVREREERADEIQLLNVWHGGGEIPKSLRKFLDEGMLSWNDYATWRESAFSCEWRIETNSFRDAVNCHGENHFIELSGERTRLEIKGEMSVALDRVRGVPRLLAGPLGRTVEQFLVKQITTNLATVSGGITRYLEAEAMRSKGG